MTDDTVSLTYEELADRLGITVKSAKHLVWRKKWHKASGNDRKARIQVPAHELPVASGNGEGAMQAPDQGTVQPVEQSPVQADESFNRIAELTAELAGVRASLDGERERREELARIREADLDAAETRRLSDLERAADQHATELASVRQLLQDRIGDLEGDRDRWAAEAERLCEQLIVPTPGFLARLFGRAA